ncbi:hypothetical protein NEMBOFW57_005157 [Staphylotrichum longicolle]|uniref:Uncharacterized protein n=1 Tax=Staphylotrichum longicolle TaxID=669026 RepID=A0AAD4HVT9_9PEZI|nr:hypothetical protein NEMBOFW57_005157 [Staphylotrichum longicolle]
MSFIQDPRLRQRWNQLSHTTEAVTSDAAAGIWTFGHRYVTPCLGSVCDALDACAGHAFCLGGSRDERARRARERDRGARGFTPRRRTRRDWDRLLAGTGSAGRYGSMGGAGDVVDQPRRKRGMSYETRSGVRKVSGEEDPNVIPRTAPLGFLGRLPFKIVGSLRYKPSAANLREHPAGGGMGLESSHGDGGGVEEHEPLLGTSDEDDERRLQSRASPQQRQRARSDTTTSGDTSSSYRSRGDLFPSDGEGDEDAVPLDDEFTVALERVDDRGSTKTRSSKGKRPADRDRDKGLSRTISRTTISSTNTPDESRWDSNPVSPSRGLEDAVQVQVPSMEDLQREEEQAEREEYEEIERRRLAASQLAIQRGLSRDDLHDTPETLDETKGDSPDREPLDQSTQEFGPLVNGTTIGDTQLNDVEESKPSPATPPEPALPPTKSMNGEARRESTFVPARLPHFG